MVEFKQPCSLYILRLGKIVTWIYSLHTSLGCFILPPQHISLYFPQSYSCYVSTDICIDNHIIVLTNKWFRLVDIGYKGLKASRTVVQEGEPPSTFISTVHEIFL